MSEQDIGAITPTICDLMAISRPRLSQSKPIRAVVNACSEAGVSVVERCLIYAPDAVGRSLLNVLPAAFSEVLSAAPLAVSLRSVYPPKTPVCFASMFTGAPPEVHGIQSYERPVLGCETLFDMLAGEGKRAAIVSVKDASVDVIFRGRGIDYFSESCDDLVTERALELLEADRHEFILAYHQAYDDILHEIGPYAPEALRAAGGHVSAFLEMAAGARESWSSRAGLVVFAPDHGAHADNDTGRGAHGFDIPEDMELMHFFGILA